MADLGLDVSDSKFKPAKSLAGPGLFSKMPRTMTFATGHPMHDIGDPSPIGEDEENKAPAVVILSKKASSTTRKKIIAPRT